MKSLITFLICCMAVVAQAQLPGLDWARNYTGFSGTDIVYTNKVTTDKAGNSYTSGFFTGSIDFDPGPKTSILTTAATDGFITKTSPSGALIWVKQFKTDFEATQLQVCINKAGEIFVAGLFQGIMDADPGPGTAYYSVGANSLFLTKLDSAGNYKWNEIIDAGVRSMGDLRFILDRNDNMLLTGSYNGVLDMDPGPGVFKLGVTTCSGGSDFFVLKLDYDGNFKWAKNIGENCSRISCSGLTTDSRNNIYLTGSYFNNKDFDPGPGIDTPGNQGAYDIYLSKLDSNGNYIRVSAIGSTSSDYSNAIAADNADNLYITGSYSSRIDFDPGPDSLILLPTGFSSDNIFVARYTTAGNVLWARNFANPPATGSGYGHGISLACDKEYTVNTLGLFYGGLDFDPGPDTAIMRSFGGESLFISRLDSAGNFKWAGQSSSTYPLEGSFIHADTFHNLYISGSFSGTADLDPGTDSLRINAWNFDGFLQKLHICYPYDTAVIVTCRNYTLDGHNYTSDGTYTQLIKTATKCDQSFTFNLTLDQLNDTITQSGITLTAAAAASSYQWVDCPAFTPVAGAINRTFIPGRDGTYALILKKGSCTDTSDCITVTGTGFTEWSNGKQLLLIPNPAHNRATLLFPAPVQGARIELLSLTGSLLFQAVFSGDQLELDISRYPAGLYLLKVKQQDGSQSILKLSTQ